MAVSKLVGSLSPVGTLTGSLYRIIDHTAPIEYYDGEYEATPTRETQTFPTIGLGMKYNFVVHPIPKNYGLITWDGSTMTVS